MLYYLLLSLIVHKGKSYKIDWIHLQKGKPRNCQTVISKTENRNCKTETDH